MSAYDTSETDWADADLEERLDSDAAFARAVETAAWDLRVREAARAKLAAEKIAEAPGFDAGTLGEILARPPEPAHRAEGLIPWAASTLIVAQRKTGKTTLTLNLARALLEGGDFLGRFPVKPVTGRVALLNFEVSAAMVAGWAHDVGVDPERFVLVNLRGRRNPLSHAEDRANLAALLREQEVESLIVDPFGRAFTGRSQNDAAEVNAWLVDLDTFARTEAGVSDLMLCAHAGWDGERTRGSSALEDWPDVTITLKRDKEDSSQRFLSAEGRDVLVEEDHLLFDETTRTLSLSGAGSRQQASRLRKLEALVGFVVEEVTAEPGLTGNKIGQRLKARNVAFRSGEAHAAASLAVDKGQLRAAAGMRKSTIYYPVTELHVVSEDDHSHRSPTIPGTSRLTVPTVPIGGTVKQEQSERSSQRSHLRTVDGSVCPECQFKDAHDPKCSRDGGAQ